MRDTIIGYTTGVFDLFHVGHLNILRRARQNCDYLIVGVSTDELVLNYKGYSTIIPFQERVEIIKELKCVDEVVPQLSHDKVSAYEKYKFQKIFHGDDWKGTEMYLEIEKKFISLGVEVVYFPYSQGVSTSELKSRIRETR